VPAFNEDKFFFTDELNEFLSPNVIESDFE
jgi:hypothetical protein